MHWCFDRKNKCNSSYFIYIISPSIGHMDWIGFGSAFTSSLWIGLGHRVDGLDWIGFRKLDPCPTLRYSIVVLILVVVISSLKIAKVFFIRSAPQRNFAYTFVLTFRTDLPSQILKLISN